MFHRFGAIIAFNAPAVWLTGSLRAYTDRRTIRWKHYFRHSLPSLGRDNYTWLHGIQRTKTESNDLDLWSQLVRSIASSQKWCLLFYLSPLHSVINWSFLQWQNVSPRHDDVSSSMHNFGISCICFCLCSQLLLHVAYIKWLKSHSIWRVTRLGKKEMDLKDSINSGDTVKWHCVFFER